MPQGKKMFGLISALGSYALFAYVAWKYGALNVLAKDLPIFLLGGVRQIPEPYTDILTMLLLVLAVVVTELPCTIVAAMIQQIVLGKHIKHAVQDKIDSLEEMNLFHAFFVLVVIEELFARWLFLGLIPKIPFFAGTTMFYVLFIVGNGLWALMHLSNFKDEKDKHPLRTLPQFVAGIFLTYIFVKYGLLAVILTHFASNALVFSLHKMQKFDLIDTLIIGYAFICGTVSYVLMTRPISDTLVWFSTEPQFVLPGWGIWDYVKIAVFINSCFGIIFGVLLYDRSGIGKKLDISIVGFTCAVFVLALLVPTFMYGLYWVFGLIIQDVSSRILTITIFLCLLHKDTTGSSLGRTFFSLLPNTYISICIFCALNFWAAVGYVFVSTIISLPTAILMQFDD